MNRGTVNTVKRRKERTPRVPVTVRLPADIVKKIDLDLAQRVVPVSRNNWLLEAARIPKHRCLTARVDSGATLSATRIS
jgi:hypothetical protein